MSYQLPVQQGLLPSENDVYREVMQYMKENFNWEPLSLSQKESLLHICLNGEFKN